MTLTEDCIYTIKHSGILLEVIKNGGHAALSESKPWVTASRLIREAETTGRRLPIVFAPAEDTRYLFAWALLDKLVLRADTSYTVSELTLLDPQPRKTALIKASDGRRLHPGFIRPYAICRTPGFLLKAQRGSAEATPESVILEGTVGEATIRTYERSSVARHLCIQHHGTRCLACDVDLGEVYGEIGAGFIHVHHHRPLSRAKRSQKVDPKQDLAPLCPNCHAMIHRREPPLTVRSLRAVVKKMKDSG